MPEPADSIIRVFVASAGKTRDTAVSFAVQMKARAAALSSPAEFEVKAWPHTFKLSEITYESLHKCVQSYKFGVFIFTPDDNITVDGEKTKVTRDNVIFELGLWAGAHGRDHTYVLKPAAVEMRFLTDLDGFVTQPFDVSDEQSLDYAAGKVLTRIRDVAMKEQQGPPGPASQTEGAADSVLLQQLQARLRSGNLDTGTPQNLKQGMLVISAAYGLGEILALGDELIRVRFFAGGTRAVLHGEVALAAP
jgi:hypothetical protein